jgi:3-oxoacyl-[acyl-carrier protein] reductase
VTKPWRLLVLGASGAIGTTVVDHAIRDGWQVVAVSRTERSTSKHDGIEWLHYDPLDDADPRLVFEGQQPFDGVCFAQGANVTDSLATFDLAGHLDLYRANCLSVVVASAMLVEAGLLREGGARIVVVSSIWQERARTNKLSYTMTKAAIGGFVRSASVDLGADGHLVNGVLPGVLDTPMTRSQLSDEQISRVCDKTMVGRLPDLATLADTIIFLCSERNTSISGQSLAVDLGMSNANLL